MDISHNQLEARYLMNQDMMCQAEHERLIKLAQASQKKNPSKSLIYYLINALR